MINGWIIRQILIDVTVLPLIVNLPKSRYDINENLKVSNIIFKSF